MTPHVRGELLPAVDLLIQTTRLTWRGRWRTITGVSGGSAASLVRHR